MFYVYDIFRYSGRFYILSEGSGGDFHVLLTHHQYPNVLDAFPPLANIKFMSFGVMSLHGFFT